jgi:hypothetical protein
LRYDLERAYGRKRATPGEELEEARGRRSALEQRIAHLERVLEDQMVAQGLIPDPRPRFVSRHALRMYRDFYRLTDRSVSLGMGGAVVNVSLSWSSVSEWAHEHDVPVDEAREIFFALRESRQALENEFIAPQK